MGGGRAWIGTAGHWPCRGRHDACEEEDIFKQVDYAYEAGFEDQQKQRQIEGEIKQAGRGGQVFSC